MSSNSTSPTFLFFIKCSGAKITNRVPLDMPIGSTLGDLKTNIRCKYPGLMAKNFLFGGRRLRGDSKKLSQLGIFKECSVGVTLKIITNTDPTIDIQRLKKMRSRMNRSMTDEFLQFGDALIIRLIHARKLTKTKGRSSNPYPVLQYANQLQRGTVHKNELNPDISETFGFFVEMVDGHPKEEYIDIGLYNHNFKTKEDTSMGSCQLRVDDISRVIQIEKLMRLDSASGEILLSIHRHPLVSKDLTQAFKDIIALQIPWTPLMLNKAGVRLGSFIGTEPAMLNNASSTKSILEYVLKSVSQNRVSFQNNRNVDKVWAILKSQRVISSQDAPCPTLYLSDVGMSEHELFDYLSEATPNGVKSVFYNLPMITMQDIQQDLSSMSLQNYNSKKPDQAYVTVQFKNTLAAVRALLQLKLASNLIQIGFGPPQECDDHGMIGAQTSSIIEGFLQVLLPKDYKSLYSSPNANSYDGENAVQSESSNNNNYVGDGIENKENDENEANNNKSGGVLPKEPAVAGEIFYNTEVKDDDDEYPYFWCKISDDTIMGYLKLHDLVPTFQLSIGEIQIRDSGQSSMDLISLSNDEVFVFRCTNQGLLALWKHILTVVKEHSSEVPKYDRVKQIALRKQNTDLWFQHKCYLSKKNLPIMLLYSPDGHKWFADRKMLNQYVRSCLQREQLDQISTRFTVSDLKDVLSAELFDDFAQRQLNTLIASKSNYLKCPSCSIAMEILPNPRQIAEEERIAMGKLKDSHYAKISGASQTHWRTCRMKCRNSQCMKDFCRQCWEQPYHIGDTCETFKQKKSASKCRFCWNALSPENIVQNPISKSLAEVCTNKECFEKMKVCSTKTMACGHFCLGVRDEVIDCPCIWKTCKSHPEEIRINAEDNCNLCGSEALHAAPIVILSCNHAFHFHCLKGILDNGWNEAYITFGFTNCPECRQPIEHQVLASIIDPLRELEMQIREMGLKRLHYEGRQNDKGLIDSKSVYFNDQVGYAQHTYAYFMCYECKKPYFGGARDCANDDVVDKKDLICGKCQKIESIDHCMKHGEEYLAYKCRYCCNMSVYQCWGKVHFCRSCHQPGVWDKISTYSTGKNKKAIEDYEHCPGITAQIKVLMKNRDWHKWSREEKDRRLNEVRAEPSNCPLATKHPPNGFEFGLGCTLCADKNAERENAERRAKNEAELRKRLENIMPFMKNLMSGSKFSHKHPMDENGILFYFGTKGTRDAQQYQNPAKMGMVIVNTSEMMADSEPYSSFVGRECVRCVTKPSASCWFSVDFVDKYIKPSHYTLRHYLSWDTECLRNWVIEGSIDGERWLVLRQHQNDTAMNYKGQAYTWALHDYGCSFRRLRIKQTGPNNNNHYFLACSGFDVYGVLYKEDTTDIEGNFTKAYNEQQKMKRLSLVRFWQMLSAGQAGVYHFTYEEDFDENGILYFLGSRGGQREWKNPALEDEVSVCSSSLVKDSVEISYFVGRSTLRLVSKPEDNAWMQVDFKDKLIQPSYYTLKHYLSWDTECLRNWILQASNDGIHWVTVKKHEEDTSLNEKGAAHTWPVQSRGAYRIWRIKQTGLNSNKHKYLACSGLEFYGQLFLTKFDPLSGVSNRSQCESIVQSLKFIKKAQFQSNNDKNGVIYWIGTRGGSTNWVNPGARNWIKCDASSLMRDSQPACALCGRISVRCVTQPLENSWMSVDLKNLYVSPTHYSLRHYISWDTEALRNWIFEASFDGNVWHTLRTHRNDSTLNHKGAVGTWEIKSKGAKYRVFRMRQFGVNSNKHFYLSCSGFDIYGDVYQIAHGKHKSMVKSTQASGEVRNSEYDASVTGNVPWDSDMSHPGSNGQRDDDEDDANMSEREKQDMALLREMARQEKQRLIHHLSAGNGYPFYYTKDFDECGIIYFLATDWRTAPWKNPAKMGIVTVTSSRLGKDSATTAALCGRSLVRCVCMAEKNNWFLVDFRNLFIRVTHYTLKHYDSWDTECLRNWYFEGSNDLKKFKMLKEHKKDKSLFGKGSTHTWQLDTKGKRYRAFRIRQFGHNSNKHWYLACSGIEFYGEIYFKPK